MEKYNCKKIDIPINVDGNLCKQPWEEIQEIQLVETLAGAQPKQRTTVKMAWNSQWLYAAFRCEDDFINASFTEYNDPLYDEEVVEVFLDDNGDRKTYLEFEVNPLNALLHYGIYNDLEGRFAGYARTEKRVVTAVQRDEEKGEWSVEIAIPMNEFLTAPHMPPEPGDIWRMNLYRIDRPRDGQDEYSAWCPTGKINFHRPECFGELVFCE